MIKSMTAFSNTEKTKDKLTVRVEIRSYNHRYSDILLRIPQIYNSLEDKIKTMISEKIARGHVEFKLDIKDDSEDAYGFQINMSKALAYYNSLVQLKEKLNIGSEITLEILTRGIGILEPADVEKDMDARWLVIRECISEALNRLDSMRKKEGDFIAQDFIKRLNYIEEYINKIEKASHELLEHYQERLRERIFLLTTGLVQHLDSERIEQEAAFLADKSDISEEILRVKSHIQQFRNIVNSPEPSGRKLNFLLQEFNREFNTIGSKTGSTEVSHTVVEAKSELEKIREQVQNIE